MKTINEASKEIVDKAMMCDRYDSMAGMCMDVSKKSIEFAQLWISVEEELPEEDGQFLVKENNGISLLFFNTHYNCWDDEDGDDYYSDSVGGKVTHWRPIELK